MKKISNLINYVIANSFDIWINKVTRISSTNHGCCDAMKKLKDRSYGFEFSGMEYTLIFKSDNMGFVRFANNSKLIFSLDPSPFLPDPKPEVYIIDGCPIPDERKLIRITLMNSEDKIIKSNQSVMKVRSNYVRAWEEVNPNKLIYRKALIQEEFVSYFEQPYKSLDPDRPVTPIATALAMYAVSTPILGANNKGGLNTAIRSDNDAWNPLEKKILQIIPREFIQTSSSYFYKYEEKESIVNPLKPSEVNLAFKNPPNLVAQIPVTLLPFDLRSFSSYKENYNYLLPVARAQLLDSLLFTPELPIELEKYMTEVVYKVENDIASANYMPFKLDIGMTVPKIAASVSRMHLQPEISKEHIDEAYNTWFDALEQALFYESAPLTADDQIKLDRLGDGAKTLYYHLVDNYGVDVLIPKSALRENSPIPEWLLDEAIESLLNAGAMYYPSIHHVKLLDFNPQEWERKVRYRKRR